MAMKRKHPYEPLQGEVLDEHMIEQHGWDRQMVAQRGSQTLAGKTYHYTEEMHEISHRQADPSLDIER